MISQITPAGLKPASREIDRRLRMTAPRKHPAIDGTQGLQATGADQIRGPRAVRNGHFDGTGPIVRRHAGSDALARVDRRGERRLEPRAVDLVVGDQRQPEFAHALLGERERHETAGMRRHEVDRFRRRLLGRDVEVALVLAIRAVDQNHHPAAPHVGQDLADDEFGSGVCAHGVTRGSRVS